MSEKIGRQLLQAREARSLSLEEAAHATRIKPYYLQAIESGDFSGLPSPAQGRGFIRTYANFLGLDPQVLLADLPEKTAPPPVTPLPQARSAPEPEISTDQADAIFIEIGRTLRHQREILGLSLEDVEKHTHLRLHYLKALEAGDLSAMPSPVQGRGMLHNYGEFLGLDP